jgi:16S rRNA (uracil1498-N3)-methyltransferase
MNLVIVEHDEVSWPEGLVRLTGARAAHLIDVLKAAPGAEVRVGLLDGPRGVASITGIGAGVVDLQCVFETEVPPRPRVDLLLALPRPKVMRRLWAQIAALGVGRVVLTNAWRVERDYFDAQILSPECYRPLLIEGLQQARDTRLPEVSVHKRFRILIEDDLDTLFAGELRLLANPSLGGTPSVRAAVSRQPAERVLVAIGPEGGWNDFEIQLLESHGFQSVSMGARTLRSDTACVALLALVHQALEG